MKKNILILGLITFAFNLFSQNVIFRDLDIKAIEKNEKELGSVKLENEFEEILGLNLYPYGSNYKLTQPYKYKRNKSDFRVSSECEYYFDLETNKLKYFDIKWRPQNDVDIMDFQGYDKLLTEEINHKEEYRKFFKQLNDSIISKFGQPSKHKDFLPNISTNSDGEQYKWTLDNCVIITEIQLPKKGQKEFMIIKYNIYWK